MKTIYLVVPIMILGQIAVAQPPNDDFEDGIKMLGLSGQFTGTNTGATMQSIDCIPSYEPDVFEPQHAGHPGDKSVWFTWNASVDSVT